MTADPDQFDLVERWRLRHALPDVVGLWANAQASEARALAFNAIVQDPRVLQRAARSQATKMAAQAEDYILSLERTGSDKSDAWVAITRYVQRSVAAWRNSLKTYDRTTDGVDSTTRHWERREPLNDPWEIARRNFPLVSDATGNLATRIIREFGGEILKCARSPWDQVIALAVLRHAARKLRDNSGQEPDPDTLSDISTVQSYATETGLSPLLVAYSGPGRPITQAFGLLHDARALHQAVSAGGDGEDHRLIWREAVGFHSYAIVALDRRILLDLPLEDAYEIATAAIRHADAAVQCPHRVAMPRLPDHSVHDPKVVRLYARACLPPSSGEQ